MTRPLVVDLYCCGGGAAAGYDWSGCDVVGVDIEPQPDYPFPFVLGDALEVIDRLMSGGRIATYHYPSSSRGPVYELVDVAAWHASPPCQASSALTKGTNKGREYPQLIPQTRELLAATGMPHVIENVQGSDLRRDLVLCGEMFGLDVIRHRYFEVNGFPVLQPEHVPHRGRVRGWRHGTYYDGPYVAVYGDGGGKGSIEEWQKAMGIDWTSDRRTLAEAIPPAYTRYIGEQLVSHLEEQAA